MKASEFRIGNIVMYSSIEVLNIEKLKELDQHPDRFGYVMLTSEWLQKFGFIRRNNAFVGPGKDSYLNPEFSIWAPYINEQDFRLNDTVMCPKIDHVHQLQNLYFALTGTELEIKS